MDQRSLKFRVWDNENKEWLNASNKNLLTFKDFTLFGECMLCCPPPINKLEYLDVEMYSGYDDVDGQMIYEGDICEHQNDDCAMCIVMYQRDGFVVEYPEFGNYVERLSEDFGFLKIVGNIREGIKNRQ